MSLQDLIDRYLEFEAGGTNPADPAFTALKGELGEEIADIAVEQMHGARAKARAVPTRGRGAPVLDRLYELGDGRYLSQVGDELILVEAKFGEAHLSRSNFNRRFHVSPSGQATRISAAEQVTQLDPDWFRARVKEISKREGTLLAKGAHAPGSLADQLDKAAKEGKILVYEVRSSLEVKKNGAVVVRHQVLDHSKYFSDYYRTGTRPPLDREGRYALRESLAKFELKSAKARFKTDSAAVTKYKNKLKRAKDSLTATEKELAAERRALAKAQKKKNGDVKTPQRRIKTLEARAKTKGKAIEALQAQVKDAEQALEGSKKAVKIHEADAAREAKLRKAEALKKTRGVTRGQPVKAHPANSTVVRRGAPQPPPADIPDPVSAGAPDTKPAAPQPQPAQRPPEAKAPAGASTAVSGEARATQAVDQAARGAARGESVAARATTDAVAASRPAARRGAAQVAKAGAAAAARKVGGYALRGGRAVWTAGKYVMRVVNLASPIMDLLMVVDAVDALVAWLQREEREAREEWARVAEFLSAPGKSVEVSPYGYSYQAGLGRAINGMLANKLGDPKADGNFLHWLHKWETEPAWSGFVYGTVKATLNRQSLSYADDDEPHPVIYYMDGALQVFTSDKPLDNHKTETARSHKGNADPENFRTRGEAGPGGSETYAPVEVSTVEVRYTYPDPILTPFDFIQAKANALVGQIVAFLSKYDENLPQDMDARTDLPGAGYVNWLADYQYSEALNQKNIAWSLDLIHWAIDQIDASAGLRDKDSARTESHAKFNAGYLRRLALVERLAKPPKIPKTRASSSLNIQVGVFEQVSRLLLNAVANDSPKYLSPSRDTDLDDLTPEGLMKLADAIDDDVRRVQRAIKSKRLAFLYNYEGSKPPPDGAD